MRTLCFDLGKTLIMPALSMAKLDQPGLAELLGAIAIAESSRTTVRRHGPFGMTAWMHQRLWDCYIALSPDLACHIRGLASQRGFLIDPHRELDMNWGYATALAGLNCLYYGAGQIPDGYQPEQALDLWRRGWHRGHKVPAGDFLSAYGEWHQQDRLVA